VSERVEVENGGASGANQYPSTTITYLTVLEMPTNYRTVQYSTAELCKSETELKTGFRFQRSRGIEPMSGRSRPDSASSSAWARGV
jgi:hypothetical protein